MMHGFLTAIRAPLLTSRSESLSVAVALAVATVIANSGVSNAGELLTFGVNQYGQIGDGTTGAGTTSNSRSSPVPIAGMNYGITAMGAGGAHSLVAKSGALYGWGLNNYGQIGNGATVTGAVQSSTTPQPGVVLVSGVTDFTTGLYSSMAIANGALYSFGANTGGVLASGEPNYTSTPLPVTGMNGGVTAVAMGRQHAIAVRNGAAYAWGYNVYGQVGNGAPVGGSSPNVTTPYAITGLDSGVTHVAAGGNHTMALKGNTLYAWGSNQYGQLGNNGVTGTSSLDALYNTPQAVVGLPTGAVTDIAAANDFSMALVGGAVYAWGQNTSGQLGNGTTTLSAVPVAVSGISGTIVDIEAGSASGYALDADGSLWSWGNNTYGQLGNGSMTGAAVTTPQHVFAATGYRFTAIESGSTANHVMVTRSALPVYFKGEAGNSLLDVANYATTVAGTTAAPIAPVESTDIYFGTTNATVANLSATVATNMVANSLTFGTGVSASNAVTLGGVGSITLYADKNSYAAGTGIVVQPGSAAVTINAPIVVGQSQNWTNNAATALVVNGAVDLGSQTLTLAGSGNTSLTGVVSGSGGLAVVGSGTTVLGGANTYAGGTTVNNTAAKVRVSSAASAPLLSGAGTNIANGQVAFEYSGSSPLATIKSLLTAGYADAFASGVLRSSTASATRGLGYKDDGSAVIVMATIYGDATLDGKVDFNDFLALQANFNAPDTRFDQGNFNYDGLTNFNDFLILQANFGQSVTGTDVAFTQQQVAAMTAFASANVPEPSLLALAGLGMAAALRRSRGRSI